MTQQQIREQQEQQEQLTGEVLLAGFAPHEDFATLLKAYKIPPTTVTPTYMLLENQPRHVIAPEERQDLLCFARFDPDFDFTSYTSGRIFHKYGELRWERLHPRIQIVYTGSAAYQPVLDQSEEEPLNEPQERCYLLFGKRLDDKQMQRIGKPDESDYFAEVRIPRLLHYPPTDQQSEAERLQLVVCEYLDPDTRANIAYRFKGLTPFEKKTGESNA